MNASPRPRREDVLPILGRIAIFGGMTEEHLAAVLGLLGTRSLADGEVLFRAGDPPDNIYIIRSGGVRIVAGERGSALELARFGVGDCFGEMSVIGIQPHSATAIGLGGAELLVLSRSALNRLHREAPEAFGLIILNAAREACRRLLVTDNRLLHYARGA